MEGGLYILFGVGTVGEIACLGDRVNAGRGCETAVTVKISVSDLSLGNAVCCCMEGGFL